MPNEQGAGWAPVPVQMDVEREKILHILEFELTTIKHLSSRYNGRDMPGCRLIAAVINIVFVHSDSFSKAGVSYSDQEGL